MATQLQLINISYHKQENISSLFGLKCASVYGIKEVRVNQTGLKLNGALENLFCGKDADLLAINKHALCEGKRRRALLVGNKGFSLV